MAVETAVVVAETTSASGDAAESDDSDDPEEVRAAVDALETAPPRLEREMVAPVLAEVRPEIVRCNHGNAGVSVSVTVMPAGTVERADRSRQRRSPGRRLRLAGDAGRALFPMTQRGGSFTYQF